MISADYGLRKSITGTIYVVLCRYIVFLGTLVDFGSVRMYDYRICIFSCVLYTLCTVL